MRFHQDGVYAKSPETFLRNAIVGVRIELDNPKSSYKQAYISIDDRFFRIRPSYRNMVPMVMKMFSTVVITSAAEADCLSRK